MIGNGGSGFFSKPEDAIYQALSANGDGSGAISQNVSGTLGAPVLFFVQPPSDERYFLKRINIEAIDLNWSNALQYGATGSALTNGIRTYVRNDSGILIEFTRDKKITRTHDWGLLSGVDAIVTGASGADPLLVRWTLERGMGILILNGSENERLVISIEDDLTGLDDQIAMAQGYRSKIS